MLCDAQKFQHHTHFLRRPPFLKPLIEDNNDPKFCEMSEFETVMPGDSKLKIDVVDYDGWTATKSGFGFVRMTLPICLRGCESR